MINAYINYPQPHMTIHRDPNDPMIRMHNAPHQRKLRIDSETLQSVVEDFKGPMFIFRAEQGLNDVWLNIDFGDVDFESEVAKYLLRILGNRYTPLRGIEPKIHC